MQNFHHKLSPATAMLNRAQAGHYAVGHFNINNLEWTKTLLETAQATKTPIILGVSEGAIKYMGGYKTVVNMVNGLLDDLNITVEVVLHLDHGQSQASAFKAIDAGFSSVMYDGSHQSAEENEKITRAVIAYGHTRGVSVEAEIGSIGGEEDGVIASGELGDPAEAQVMAGLGIDFLAAGFGNIHGKYPANWKGLSFDVLQKIAQAARIPLVLHGGSGIPTEQVCQAIKLGICKINVNTECQVVFCEALRAYFSDGKDLLDKGYDPRKILKPGTEAIKKVFTELVTTFGSLGKSQT